jgi:hypothetical protein
VSLRALGLGFQKMFSAEGASEIDAYMATAQDRITVGTDPISVAPQQADTPNAPSVSRLTLCFSEVTAADCFDSERQPVVLLNFVGCGGH